MFSGCFLLAVFLRLHLHQCRISNISAGNLPGQRVSLFFFAPAASFAWPLLRSFVAARAPMQEMMLASSQASVFDSASSLVRDFWLGASFCCSRAFLSWQRFWSRTTNAGSPAPMQEICQSSVSFPCSRQLLVSLGLSFGIFSVPEQQCRK